ncbi:hypothetical protein [Halovulum sp. GXIMD14793]
MTTAPVLHLHLGAHKTATSFMQKWLSANDLPLREAGVWLETPKTIRQNFKDPMAFGLPLKNPEPALAASREQARVWLKDLMQGAEAEGMHTVLLSDETLLSAAGRALGKGRLDLYIEKYLTLLGSAVEGQSLRLFLAIRDPGAWASSLLADLAASPRGDGDLDLSAIRAVWLQNRPSWMPVIRGIRSAFPDAPLTVWRYEDFEALQPTVMRQLCNNVPLPIDPPEAVVRAALPGEAIEKLLAIRNSKSGKERVRAIRAVRARFADQGGKSRYSLWTPEEAAQFTDDYEREVARIATLSGVTFLRPPGQPTPGRLRDVMRWRPWR